ncbi:MAG: helix-turn-helix domain-containing protein [Prevotellaceae bacterium]|jgi:transcriptional regulator with XRE-family HTH domain|nr:helix-turn-helix domain-containing protein [Prevotellaceae bacterium]
MKKKQTRKDVCKMIADARKRRKLSTYKLAEMTGVARPNISRIENAYDSIGIDLILVLLNALDCKIEISDK